MKTLGIIGAGNMGSALIQGWEQDQSLCLKVYDKEPDKLRAMTEQYRIIPCNYSQEAVLGCECILVGVKPLQIKEVLTEIAASLGPDQCLISIAAGIPQKKLTQWIQGKCPVVRVMPNTPALIGSGVFGLCFDDHNLADFHKGLIRSLFQKLGSVHVLEESLFDAFTALIGSGPAYVFYFLEGLIEAGVTLGLTRSETTEMVIRLFSGSVSLVEKSHMSISQLREQVCSPAGTTITGVNELDRRGVRGAIIDSVDAACRRSVELK